MNFNYFRDLKIRKKIFLVFIISVVIPVIIIVQVIIQKATDKLVEQTVYISNNFVSKISSNLIDLLDDSLSLSKRVCFYDKTLKDILAIRNNYKVVDNIEIYPKFRIKLA